MRKFFIAAALAVAALVNSASTAQATFQMRITSHNNVTNVDTQIIINDEGAGDLALGTPGQILFSGPVGAFSINVDTGLSFPVMGGAMSPQMDLSYVATRITGGDAATLTIEISHNGLFTFTPGDLAVHMGGTQSGGMTSTTGIAGSGYNDVLYNTSDVSSTPLGGLGASYGGSTSFYLNSPNTPYSLTLRTTIASNGSAGASTGNLDLRPTPAPAGLVLGLVGLPFVGAYVRRRRATQTA
jgi:hypothetical protein